MVTPDTVPQPPPLLQFLRIIDLFGGDSRSVCLLRSRGEFSRYFPVLLSDEGAPGCTRRRLHLTSVPATWTDIYHVQMNNLKNPPLYEHLLDVPAPSIERGVVEI